MSPGKRTDNSYRCFEEQKLNVIFVMRTLCVVCFFAGTPQDKADSALYSARIPEGHRYNTNCEIAIFFHF